ncbi:MAG: O-succinylhomoserine sulfhydrylase [Rhodospirillales bacterium]|nr:O-succinylhomoserine sulfhydrylase [Rhodospirillales bacterium]MDE0378644.1 O-succinylhomoserine sulfhydrylase [Rhodospirillales bacterium]
MEQRQRERAWAPATQLVRGGTERSHHGETNEALYLTSGFVYETAAQGNARTADEEDGYVYGRFGNPTVTMFEDRLALIEGADACQATATGMAAVFAALMCQLRAGDHVVASRVMFGACHVVIDQLLPRYGIETDLVDGTDLDAWERALRPETRCVFLESPGNPTMPIVDIAAVSALSHGVGARVIVDNVLGMPMVQRPLALGADIVVYSTTKHIDGQGRALGGAILSDEEFFASALVPFVRTTGPVMSPFNAWVMLKGLETLELRTTRMCETAERLATFLEDHPAVAAVHYPGLPSHPQNALAAKQMSRGGSVVAFDLAGGRDAAFRFLDSLELIDISNNLGDAKSLATHPASTTHQKIGADARAELGIGDGLIRLSVGLEAEADLRSDLEQALGAAAGS